MSKKQKVISVYGSGTPLPGSADYEAARAVGRLLAEAGFAVQTGGYGGVMSGVSQGADEAGGHVIGVTCAQIETFRLVSPNRWVKEELKRQTLRERLLYLVDNCDGAIVMPGGVGTLLEMMLIWNFVLVGEIAPRPIIAVGGLWQRTLAAFVDDNYVHPACTELITTARTVHEAVKLMVGYLGRGEE